MILEDILKENTEITRFMQFTQNTDTSLKGNLEQLVYLRLQLPLSRFLNLLRLLFYPKEVWAYDPWQFQSLEIMQLKHL